MKYEIRLMSKGRVNGLADLEKVLATGLNIEFCAGFSEQSIREGTLPDGVLGVVSAIAFDLIENERLAEDAEMGVRVVITLLVEIDMHTKVEFQPPCDLLTRVADAICTIDDQCLVCLERNWKAIGAVESDAGDD